MARRIFQPARREGSAVPRIRTMLYKTAEAIIRGSLTVTDADGLQTLCGADPAVVRGVALNAAGSHPGYEVANDSLVVARTGVEQSVEIALAEDEVEFSGAMYNGANLVTPLQTHINTQYGVVKQADGIWTIDETDTTNVVVEITDIVEAQGGDPGFHLFKFLDAVQEA